MDHVVKIKKGLDIQLEGIPSPKTSNTPDSQLYAIIPDDFVGLTPKVIVKPGEKVLTGSPVIHDKTHPNIVVASPVSGEIVTIERGERRKVIKITIKPDASQQALEFGRFDLENMDSSEIKDLLLKSGIFAFIKQRPYDTAPRDIFVTAFDSAPLAPDYAFILKEEKQHFETGLKALNKLTSGKVYVGISQRQPIDVKNATSVIFDGPHPAGNVGIQINHRRHSMDDERSRRTLHRKTIRQRHRRLFSHSRRYRLRNRRPALRTHPYRRIHRFHHTRYGKSGRIRTTLYQRKCIDGG